MVYCMSDIYGEMDRFQQMLELIQFSGNDQLYIIGDVIDRYALGVDVLWFIMKTANMTMLLGNHEQMCFDTLGPTQVYGARDLWRNNGGSPTYRELLYHRTAAERKEIFHFIEALPDHLEIQVGDRKFYLVHGMTGQNTEERIWNRPMADFKRPFKDETVIVGHTPTCYMTGCHSEPFQIWHGNGIIDIDCGCGNKTPLRRLACLRLDDMKEFYV